MMSDNSIVSKSDTLLNKNNISSKSLVFNLKQPKINNFFKPILTPTTITTNNNSEQQQNISNQTTTSTEIQTES
jgi:hypothetical protein